MFACHLHWEAAPTGMASFRAVSARLNLADDTIFIVLVIFWMFVTDLRRMATRKKNERIAQDEDKEKK